MEAHARGIIGLYERHALAWDHDRGKTLFEKPWLDRFLGIMPEQPSVLDLGCGAGEPLAAYMIGHGSSVTGIDTSVTLISLALGRFPNHDWRVADMRSLDLRRGFDGILAWDSFFHLTRGDQREMFEIFRRHALPGAALMFTSGPAKGEALGSYQGEVLFHASLDPDEYRRFLKEAGFEVVAHRPEDSECGGHTVWLARKLER